MPKVKGVRAVERWTLELPECSIGLQQLELAFTLMGDVAFSTLEAQTVIRIHLCVVRVLFPVKHTRIRMRLLCKHEEYLLDSLEPLQLRP